MKLAGAELLRRVFWGSWAHLLVLMGVQAIHLLDWAPVWEEDVAGTRQSWGQQASETRSVIRVDTWGDSSALPHAGALIWGPSSLHWQAAPGSDFSFSRSCWYSTWSPHTALCSPPRPHGSLTLGHEVTVKPLPTRTSLKCAKYGSSERVSAAQPRCRWGLSSTLPSPATPAFSFPVLPLLLHCLCSHFILPSCLHPFSLSLLPKSLKWKRRLLENLQSFLLTS